MNKEELIKIYSAYLPYNLKGKRTDGGEGDYILRAVYDDGSLIWKYDGFGNSTQIGVMPVLYDLSYLTKEIEHEGKRFVPIVKWVNLPIWANLKSCGYADKHYYAYFEIEGEVVKYKIPADFESMNYYTIQKLLQWHLNVFNIPADQFINKATLNK